ncbi:hypothetical protein JQS43_18660 [Natronosporangium hydrolyticum]|uniref:Uncharacterized protein n=1 Tax=Natronosporangium hydrolyticum TaxID=2811111 RepID=A0A895YIB9_9ACTN|nr:hypothetical protein [Natronosporangium hydrolyticum]QSB17587.1 hypothetical protein JQS43_18660 [Natronosporangium hydrolyticum]
MRPAQDPQDRRARPERSGADPARREGMPAAVRRPWHWLTRRLNPLQSWLVVMAVIVGLSLLGLRLLALAVAVAWSAYAVFTWLRPSARRRLRR